jgi:hypothetical protein
LGRDVRFNTCRIVCSGQFAHRSVNSTGGAASQNVNALQDKK